MSTRGDERELPQLNSDIEREQRERNIALWQADFR